MVLLLSLVLALPGAAQAQSGYVGYGNNACTNDGLGTESCVSEISYSATSPLTPVGGSVQNGANTTLDQTVFGSNGDISLTGGSDMYRQFSIGYTDETTDGPFNNEINGGNINFTNQGDLGWAVTDPGMNIAFAETSIGGDGSAKDSGNVEAGIYNAGYGGTVSFTDEGQFNLSGAAPGARDGSGVEYPYIAEFYGLGIGGDGTGAKANDDDYGGDGGNGGTMYFDGLAGSAITLAGSGSASNAIDGIVEVSIGGLPGCLCSGDHPNTFGTSGTGGYVAITEAGSITSTANYSNAIVAVSQGGAGGTLPGNGVGNSGGGTSGAGGAIDITLASGASIDMAGGNGVGIFAESSVGASVNDYATLAELSGGTVDVYLDQGSTLMSAGGTRFNLGVLAISSGTANLLQPFASSTVAIGGTGYGGNVNIYNSGTVVTNGELAVGLAGISVGGAGIVTAADSGGTSYLGSTASNTEYAVGGSVLVDNSGSVTTDGASAIGLAAISAGAGGLLANDNGPAFSNGAVTQGVVVGGAGDTGQASPGGGVTVDNYGVVTTGDGQGGGKVAIGIVAQSIGGGGGSSGGSGADAFIGDAGGSGGNGGGVTVNLFAGSGTTTYDDGALGVLAQSIGGGGGNGANAAGIFVALGGQGGDGGDGGGVTVSLAGGAALTTAGDFAGGVIAQSVGGGGGNGGYADSAGIFVSAAIGGAGGDGGSGGAVTFKNAGTLQTSGQDSLGVLAQSVGGGGGNGGAANSYVAGTALTVAIAVGGTGGGGGGGGTVNIQNSGGIGTLGPDSIGIVAQSIGGGGGAGGASVAKSLAIGTAEIPAVSFSVSLGGAGGNGGAGSTVTVDNAGSTITTGAGAAGILAQSVGGGGGNGGDSTAVADGFEGATQTLKIAVALGASGGGGGDGGVVTLDNGGFASCPGCVSYTSTGGNNAPALLAQSIGGGGGNGGAGSASTSSPNVGGSTGTAVGINFGLGASGGVGGLGNTVTVANAVNNPIKTVGSGSQGILAQSIGGGGGNAGGGSANGSGDNLDVNVAVGGTGGSGNDGGGVLVSNASRISTGQSFLSNNGSTFTIGGDASGILAQSIGGGGGAAGSSDAAASISAEDQVEDLINTPADSYSANVSLGGSGGAGGSGDTVTVNNSGAISTLGIRAYGIAAQSIGGGGGTAGAATSAANAVLGGGSVDMDGNDIGNTYAATVSVGGAGGASGSGDAVTVANSGQTGAIFTAGYGADGILAQSIGGGGGAGAEGTANNTTTLGLGADYSGQGGAAGAGGGVTVTSGAIATLGDDALGILAQSIGGGGGTAGASCSNSAAASLQGVSASACYGNVGATLNTAPWNDASDLTLDVGGGSGASGDGAGVGVTVTNIIETAGARAIAVAAQSIGGGGGYAAAAAVNLGATTLGGDPGSNNGVGGTVNVNLDSGASITTAGAGAWGILAQSIGGGGGFAGDSSLNLQVLMSNQAADDLGGPANGGSVNLTMNGDITTTGRNAHGIFAQSIGGTGGIAGGGGQAADAGLLAGTAAQISGLPNTAYDGGGGAISITQGAPSAILTSGAGSVGIIAQSSGNDGQVNPISVTIGGSVIGGTNAGYAGGVGAAGILLSGGGIAASDANSVTVENGGSVGTVDGTAGTAISAADGYTNIANAGTITGSIDIGAAAGVISNSGLLNTGATLQTASLTNSNIVAVAGAGVLGATALTGSYTQTGTGVLAVDLDALAVQTSDVLTAGGPATLAGTIQPYALNLLPGAYTVLRAAGLSSTATVAAGPLFIWSAIGNGNDLTISPQANFTAAAGLTADRASVAAYLQTAWTADDAAFAGTFARLANLPSRTGAAAEFDAFSARATQIGATYLKDTESAVFGAPMSCPVFTGGGALLGEGSCVWSRVNGQVMDQYAADGTPGFATTSNGYHIGGQREFAPGWFAGGAVGTSLTWSGMSNGSSSDGQVYDGSLAIKHQLGNWLFAGALGLADGAYDNHRLVVLPGVSAALTSHSNALLSGGRLRAAYDVVFPNWYMRPILDLDIVNFYIPGYRESGISAYALNVHASDQTSFTLAPTLEIGGRAETGRHHLILRYYADLGVGLQPSNTQKVQVNLLAAQPGDGSFQTTIGTPNVIGDLDLGVQLYQAAGFELKLDYGLQTGREYLAQGGTLRLAYHF